MKNRHSYVILDMLLALFVLFIACKPSLQCGSIGGGVDSRIYANPSLQWEMSPPASWTYPVPYAQQTGQFFPQQPLTQQDALNKAQADMQAAVITALSANNLPSQNIRVTTGYTPQEISDCVRITAPDAGMGIPSQIEINQPFGVEEQGAITRIAQSTEAVTVALCTAGNLMTVTYRNNIVQGSLKISGLTLSGYQMRILVAKVQSILNFRFHVRFQSPIRYS